MSRRRVRRAPCSCPTIQETGAGWCRVVRGAILLPLSLLYFSDTSNGGSLMSPKPQPNLVLRTAVPEDSPACGQICYDAFSTLSGVHGFPCDFPGPEAAIGVLSMMFSNPGFYCVVAEHEGRIVGSNCLDERSVISGVGPISIDPGAQNLGIGRRLMQAVVDRANEQGAAGIRLVQAAFHNRSLSLYAGLGFDIREPLACMQGRTVPRSLDGCIVRPAERADLSACNALCRRVHGFDRGTELAQAIQQDTRSEEHTSELQ